MITVVNSLKEIDPNLNMHDVVNGTSGHDIYWAEIAGDTGRRPDDSRTKVISIWRERHIKIYMLLWIQRNTKVDISTSMARCIKKK